MDIRCQQSNSAYNWWSVGRSHHLLLNVRSKETEINMSMGFVFWLIMLLSVLMRGYVGRANLANPAVRVPWVIDNIILLVLLGLLGWHDFGPPVHQ